MGMSYDTIIGVGLILDNNKALENYLKENLKPEAKTKILASLVKYKMINEPEEDETLDDYADVLLDWIREDGLEFEIITLDSETGEPNFFGIRLNENNITNFMDNLTSAKELWEEYFIKTEPVMTAVKFHY